MIRPSISAFPEMSPEPYDVLVIGGGLAALCVALAAREAGASVLVVDRAPEPLRGGNARHSRNLRIAHDAPSPLFPGRYGVEEFIADLEATHEGHGDPALVRLLAQGSAELPGWLQARGVRFQLPERGALPWSRKTAFFLGGGRTLMNTLYAAAADRGVEIRYDTHVTHLHLEDARVHTVPTRGPEGDGVLRARRVVCCSGGYQADRRALAAAGCPGAQHYINRGSPHVTGDLLLQLLDQGAAPAGVPGSCHRVAVHACSPPEDGGIVTRVDGMPWGLVVDVHGRRFRDEGEEITPRRYSAWGRWVSDLPGARAHLILDDAGLQRAPPSLYPPVTANTLEDLALRLGLPPGALERTVQHYHAARVDGGDDPLAHHTRGLTPPKSRCALPLEGPPFHAWTLAPGVTFTGHGLAVDPRGRIRRRHGPPCETLYAAGMIMSPAVLGPGYVAGAALTLCAVFGRIAGEAAARG